MLSESSGFSSRSSSGRYYLPQRDAGTGGSSSQARGTSRRKLFFNNRSLGITFRSWIKSWKGKHTQDPDLQNFEDSDPEVFELQRFTYDELHRATEGFKNEMGVGVFGSVYEGFLMMGNRKRQVSVRVMRRPTYWESWWATEIKFMSQLSHKNLVELLGWCEDSDCLAVIYELLPRGSLSVRLPELPWGVRYWRIAVGLASALFYLQEGSRRCVVHMDIEPVNIMLDSDLNPKLKNFGVSRLANVQELARTLHVGTPGYQAPESFYTSPACREFDIYSFGMVALQIASGRRPFGSGRETDGLQHWVMGLYSRGSILEAADPSLGKIFDAKEMERLLLLGLWCTQKDPKSRPSIMQVADILNFQAPILQAIHLPSRSRIEPKESIGNRKVGFDIGLPPEYYCRSSEVGRTRKDQHSPIVNGFVSSLQKMLLQSNPQFEEVLGTIRDYTAILVKIVGPPLDDWNELAQTLLQALEEDKFLRRFADSDRRSEGEDEMSECIAAIEEDRVRLEVARERLVHARKEIDRALAELREAQAICKLIEEDVKLITARRARNVVMLEQKRRQSAISNLFHFVLGKHPSLMSAM